MRVPVSARSPWVSWFRGPTIAREVRRCYTVCNFLSDVQRNVGKCFCCTCRNEVLRHATPSEQLATTVCARRAGTLTTGAPRSVVGRIHKEKHISALETKLLALRVAKRGCHTVQQLQICAIVGCYLVQRGVQQLKRKHALEVAEVPCYTPGVQFSFHRRLATQRCWMRWKLLDKLNGVTGLCTGSRIKTSQNHPQPEKMREDLRVRSRRFAGFPVQNFQDIDVFVERQVAPFSDKFRFRKRREVRRQFYCNIFQACSLMTPKTTEGSVGTSVSYWCVQIRHLRHKYVKTRVMVYIAKMVIRQSPTD